MGKRPRRTFTEEQKREAVGSYVRGDRSITDIADELQISPGLIYKWKSSFESQKVSGRVDELMDSGATRAMALKIQQQEAEIIEHQKKVAQQAVIIDLLKKLPAEINSQRESELTGLIGTMNRSARRRLRQK